MRARFRITLPLIVSAVFAIPAVGDEPSFAVFQRDVQPILEKYCYDCHGNGVTKGGVQLDGFDTATALQDHKLWLRALKNVRSRVMPPADELPLPAPEAERLMAWIKRDALALDPAAPDPGRVTVRRLNRVEYRNTIRDLTGVDFDTEKEFPADDSGHGFDNMADVLTISPMLLEKYLDAAQTIVGKFVPTQPRVVAEARVPGRAFTEARADTLVPESAGAETTAKAVARVATATSAQAGDRATSAELASSTSTAAATGDASTPRVRRSERATPPAPPMRRPAPAVTDEALDLSYYTPALVTATHTLTHAGDYQVVLELQTQERYVDNQFDLNKCRVLFRINGEIALEREFTREGGRRFEFAFDRALSAGAHELSVEVVPLEPKPQLRNLRLRLHGVAFRGPQAEQFWVKPKGYEKIFPQDPPADALARREYAREILGRFVPRALRRPVEPATLDRLVTLAERVNGEPGATFGAGVAQAMVAVLASPSFIFREESTLPLAAGEKYPRVDDYALASRLSYFLWSTMPDDELLRLARQGRVRAELDAQVKRMLADRRANELVRNFTGQWLQARDIANVAITANDVFLRDYPNADYEEARATFRRLQARRDAPDRTPEEVEALAKARRVFSEFNRQTKPELNSALRQAMREETELTFAHILKEDRSVLELLDSDYTFLNEDLAKHYGIEGVTGRQMRKVTLPPDSPRGGVLTQGTVLAVTSNPTRTSPVKRGVFILEAILGAPPPPPPPDIPSLEEVASPAELKKLSLRETLALHAKEPMCASCHSRMDPLGLALENFNAMGMWRTSELGQPVQPAGKLITGETFNDIRELKRVLATAKRADFYHCLSEKMLKYALGRGVEHYDVVTLDRLAEALETSGGKLSTLIYGIIHSAPFQQRRPTTSSSLSESSPAPGGVGRLAQNPSAP
jgi:hypothetical protein